MSSRQKKTRASGRSDELAAGQAEGEMPDGAGNTESGKPSAAAVSRDRWAFLDSAVAVVLLVVVLAALGEAWRYGQRPGLPGIDLYQFWAAGKAVSEQTAQNIYSDEARKQVGQAYFEQASRFDETSRYYKAAKARQVLETYSTPLLYTAFGLGLPKRYDSAFQLYGAVCLTATLVAMAVFCLLLGTSLTFALGAMLVVLVGFEPLFSDLRVANVNQLQLGMLAVFLVAQRYLPKRICHFAAGAVMAFALTFKPNVIYVVLLLAAAWLMNRQHAKLIQTVIGGVIAGLLIFVVSSMFFHSFHIWFDWLAAVRTMPSSIIGLQLGNLSWTSLMRARLNFDVPRLAALALLAGVGACLWRAREPDAAGRSRGADAAMDVRIVAVGCLVYLLSARLAWLHYYLLVLPGILVAFRPAAAGQFQISLPPRVRYLAAAAGTILVSLSPVTHGFARTIQQQAGAANIGSLIILVLAISSLFDRPRPGRRQ